MVRRCRRSAWNHPTRVRGRCLAVVVVVAAAVVVAVESAAVAVSFAGSATASQRNKIDFFFKQPKIGSRPVQKDTLISCLEFG